MHNRVSRARFFGCAVCCGIGLVGGCENPTRTADRRVQAVLDQITPQATPAQAQIVYDQAVAAAAGAASPIEQAIVLEASAKNHIHTAADLISQINHNRVGANKLMSDIGDLVSDIRGEETLLDKWTATDPSRAQAKLASDKQSAIGPEPVWFAHDQDPIPTQAKAQADITRLQAAIDDNKSHQQTLVKQHDGIVAQADQLERQSEGETGKTSVDDFKKSSDLRKQAADVSVEVDKTQAALVPLTQDLAIAQSQLQIVQKAIENMNSISGELGGAWTELETKMQATEKHITDYDSGPAPSVASLAADLVKQLADLQSQRKLAEAQLQKAIQQLTTAQAQASIARQAIVLPTDGITEPAPSVAAAKLRVDLNGPEVLWIDQADCQQLLGDLHAAQAEDLAVRERLRVMATPVYEYKKVRLELPPGLNESLDEQRKQEVAAADDLYAKADQTLDKLNSALTPRDLTAVKNLAISRKIFLQVDWAILDPSPDKDHLGKAHEALTRLQGSAAKDVPVFLPTVVAPPPAPLAPETPGETPATTPANPDAATQPADSTPAIPAASDTPAMPATPAAPTTPAGSNTPATPTPPAAPDAPATPAAPAANP